MTDTTTTTIHTDTDTPDNPPDPADQRPAPVDKPLFTDFGVDQDLADALRERGIVHPFAIQELSLPLGLKGHDIIGQARTGTGKTLGFGLPLLQRIDPSQAQTQALVIVPTRELCIQVADDLTVGAGRGITSIAVYGGVGYEDQIEALTTGVHVVVGTPGRTLDHLGRGNLDVSGVHTVVLDEADEMLDMGFLPDVEKLLADVPDDRQTLLFSATMPTAIVKLARRFMDKPTFMRADETLHETDPNVHQHFFLVHRMDKPRVLARLLQMPGRGGAFVFCRTKRMCDRLVRELEPLGVSAIAVHGDLRQSTRERNLDRFRAGKADVLVATEVAARGLDVSNVTHVVNYDCPDDEKMYLHRIGRTARAGESGVAVTFAEFNEVDRVNVIRKRVGVTDELTEVFSTSDELTQRFDLPETTPWDEFGKAESSRRPGRGSRGSSDGGSRGSADRRRSKSSGSNRSSGRGSDRRGSDGDQERSRSSDRDRRRSTSSGSPSPSGASSTSDSSSSTSSTSESSSHGRSRTRTRSRDDRRTTRRDDTTSASDRDASSTRSADETRSSSGGPGGGGDDGRTTGGARKRARRNRRGLNAQPSRSTKAKSQDRSGDAGRERGRGDDGSTEDRRSGGERVAPRSSGSAQRGGTSDTNARDRTRTSSAGRRTSESTTRRGSDARGDGTPRLDRRVDVEHLP